MKQKLFDMAIAPLTWMFRKANAANVRFLQSANPVFTIPVDGGSVRFFCPNDLTFWRARTLLTKEPDTISWIDSFAKDDVLYDIGANVGIYSVYAAVRGLKVFAFEPESQNYAVLNRNIYLNKIQDRVIAYNVAISDGKDTGYLNIRQLTAGAALNNFGENVDYNKKTFEPVFKQAVLSYPLDLFIEEYRLPSPTHIKIDVDGLERLIVSGMSRTLAAASLKSVLIELNTKLDEDMEVVDIMSGYRFQGVSRFRAPEFDSSEYRYIYNFIFRRD